MHVTIPVKQVVWSKLQDSKIWPWVSSELWCARSGQGDQQILEQAANTVCHEKISLALKSKVTDRMDMTHWQGRSWFSHVKSSPTIILQLEVPPLVHALHMNGERSRLPLRGVHHYLICGPAPASLLYQYYLNCHNTWVKAKQLNYSGKAWHHLWLHSISQPLPSLNTLDEYTALLKILRNGLGIPP